MYQVSLSFRPSASLNMETDSNLNRGPTVIVKNLTFAINDRRSPLGHKNLLCDVSAKFDWGKLCAVMGAKDSGKSTLLHVLSGADNKPSTVMRGHLLFDGKCPDPTVKPWQRGAFVEALDDHFRDLSVRDTITYAMKLRCIIMDDIEVISENVEKTLKLLDLYRVQFVGAKHLSRGERRRLSIAEEFVTGPNFCLLDEPVTNLNAKDCAIIMNCFRELVNQEKTVVATMHEPSAEVFNLFDYLVLLSKGQVIYSGPVDKAVEFFAASNTLKLIPGGYSNPADFLADVSGCLILSSEQNYCDTPALVSNWRSSKQCSAEESRFVIDAVLAEKKEIPAVDNDSTSRTSSRYKMVDGRQEYWSGTRSVDISAKSQSGGSFYVTDTDTSWHNGLLDFSHVNFAMTLYRMRLILVRSSAKLSNPDI